jgi:two-component system copper resistance phosphate regulon response regulator CusR
MRVLGVEDDAKTAALLCRGLKEAGYLVEVTDTAEKALHFALHGCFDLVLLDVVLAHQDWLATERGSP